MKKVLMTMAMLAVAFAMQAQTKFHDALANEAKGNVKSITVSMMGRENTVNFSEDGKMTNLTDAKYDENGYLLSAKMDMMGQSTAVKFEWENGRVKSQSMEMMGNQVKTVYTYDENGVITKSTIDMGGQMMEMPYSDIKLDDQGNWISRKASMMGQEMTFTRTIVYY